MHSFFVFEKVQRFVQGECTARYSFCGILYALLFIKLFQKLYFFFFEKEYNSNIRGLISFVVFSIIIAVNKSFLLFRTWVLHDCKKVCAVVMDKKMAKMKIGWLATQIRLAISCSRKFFQRYLLLEPSLIKFRYVASLRFLLVYVCLCT